MAASTNFRPVYAKYPISVCRHSEINPLDTLQVGPDSSRIEELYVNSESAGVIIERITIQLTTNDGQTNSSMWFGVFLRDETAQNTWVLYKTATVTAVNESYSTPTPPASCVFEFQGGLLLRESMHIGVGRTVQAGSQDDFHVTLEGGRFIDA